MSRYETKTMTISVREFNQRLSQEWKKGYDDAMKKQEQVEKNLIQLNKIRPKFCDHGIPTFQTCYPCGRQMVNEEPFKEFCKAVAEIIPELYKKENFKRRSKPLLD